MNTSTTPTTNARFADCMATADRGSKAADRHIAAARAALAAGDLMEAARLTERADAANRAAKVWIQYAKEALR